AFPIPDQWYSGHVVLNSLILLIYGVCCAFPFGTGLWWVIINALFLRNLRTLTVVPLPGVIIARLRRIPKFYLKSSFVWFVGVTLFAMLYFNHLDVSSGLILLVTSG